MTNNMEETLRAEVECLRKVLAEKDALLNESADLLDKYGAAFESEDIENVWNLILKIRGLVK